MKKRIIVILIVVILIGLCFIIISSPQRIISSKLGLKLPTESKVFNYDYHWFYGYFEAKILINEEDLDYIQNELLKFFKKEAHLESNRYSLGNRPKWWDLGGNYLETYYSIEAGPEFLLFHIITVSNLAIISKQDDGQYYLYLDFVILPRDVFWNSFKALL